MPETCQADPDEGGTRGQAVALPIGGIAELTGLTIRAIRLYEEKGLLKPARDRNGMRWFDGPTLRRLVFVAQAREAGFTLAEIKVLAEGASGDSCASMSACETLMTRRFEALQVQRSALLRCCDLLPKLNVGGSIPPGRSIRPFRA